jgi:hypothetical protein
MATIQMMKEVRETRPPVRTVVAYLASNKCLRSQLISKRAWSFLIENCKFKTAS